MGYPEPQAGGSNPIGPAWVLGALCPGCEHPRRFLVVGSEHRIGGGALDRRGRLWGVIDECRAPGSLGLEAPGAA